MVKHNIDNLINIIDKLDTMINTFDTTFDTGVTLQLIRTDVIDIPYILDNQNEFQNEYKVLEEGYDLISVMVKTKFDILFNHFNTMNMKCDPNHSSPLSLHSRPIPMDYELPL